MDIKDVKVGWIYYIPVEVISVDDEVQAYYAKRKDKGLWDDFDAVDMVTKDEIVGTEIDDRVDFWKRDSESAHEEIRKLQKLLNSKEEGVRKIEEYADQLKKIADDLGDENEKLKAERDKFAKAAKDKAYLSNKACAERDAAQGDLVTAREAIDYLQEENKKLKQELKDAEQISSDAIATSNNRKYQIAIIEEVIVALVEKIRRLEGGET